MSKTNVHQEAKKRRELLRISLDGHNHRIKELKKTISDAKRDIKKHKLLKKQTKTTFQIESLQ